MGYILSTAINAVMPIILLILLGNLLRSKGFLSEAFVKDGSKLVFRIGLSCSLFVNVYSITDIRSVPWAFILYTLGITFVLFVVGFAVAVMTTRIPERRGVLLGCIFRSNFAIIGLPLATALGGDAGAAVASVVSAFVLPLYNILGVVALSIFVKAPGAEKHSLKNVLISICKNPNIIGAAAGLLCIFIREGQVLLFDRTVFSISRNLPFLFSALNHIRVLTTPLALLVMGAQFEFSAVKGMFKDVAVGTLLRIVFAPLIGIGCALIANHLGWFACGVGEIAALIALFGAPSSISSAVMAGEMGSDEQLATQQVVWTSIGSVFTIFLLVCILMATGILVI